jgi:putative CocE/NonD family hydrolase
MPELENVYIALKDGRNLSARIWLPDDTDASPVPAILEFLPYRKRDGTAQRDESNYPVFARAGYAGVRVDISGTGESDGEYDDEYSPQEHADALEVIHWIASQDWCDGNLGMMGISWGGFNSLQLAALRPAPLKAVIAIGTTVDRYNDDIHYKNGCHLYSNFSWSSTMLCYASRPPDPLLVGEQWRAMWLKRLKTQPFPLEAWLSHQRRDEYWKHGSICEDYEAITIPSLVISGWGDGYVNAPTAMAENSMSVCRAVNGPWIHKYPHFAWPRPRMDFHEEAIRWWDRWLKGEENGVEKTPAYRAYISQSVRPGGYRSHEPGRWVAENQWPSASIKVKKYFLGRDRTLCGDAGEGGHLTICTPQDCGIACGEVFTLKPDSELAGDQRIDDAGSLVFETPILESAVEILGRPALSLRVAVDRPMANLAVRLIDVHPDGSSFRVSWGVLNLSHRTSNEYPSPMTPGQFEEISIDLNECGYHFAPGHRIRVSLSTAYWPMIVPPPEVVTATVELAGSSFLSLPIRPGGDLIQLREPSNPDPLPQYRCHGEPSYRRTVEKDLHGNCTHFRVFDDTGDYETAGHGMRIRHTHEECWSISPDDPTSYHATSTYICYMQRGDWNIKTVSESSMQCDTEDYRIRASIVAWEGDEKINSRNWDRTLSRDYT